MGSRLVPLLPIGLLSLAAAGCTFAFHEYEVRNESPNAVQVAFDFGDCSSTGPPRPLWQDLQPGQTTSSFSARLAGRDYGCLFVADARGRVIFNDSSAEGGVFAVRGSTPTVTRVGDGDTWEFNGWILAIYLVPLALGMPFALFITGRYFYRYYISKRGLPPA